VDTGYYLGAVPLNHAIIHSQGRLQNLPSTTQRKLMTQEYEYIYNKEYQTLQQFTNGKLVSSMSMPEEDLFKIRWLCVIIVLDEQADKLKD
jgi:hypothetical protein